MTANLTAQKLRLILIGGIILLIVIAVVIFTFSQSVIAGYATDVKKATMLAESSSTNLTALNQLKTTLAENSDAVLRTKNLVAESQSYAYQDQIIKDINTFAAKSGVEVSGYQFGTEGLTGTSATPAAGAAATPVVSGLKTVSVSVSLKSPIEYRDIMNFVHMIEQSLTKMQLAGISMESDTSAAGKVTVSSLTLEVYVR